MADLESNSEMLSTKEFLKQKRKREYEMAKELAKEKRKDEKRLAAEEKSAARIANDKALWGLIKDGNAVRPQVEEIDPANPEKASSQNFSEETTYELIYD